MDLSKPSTHAKLEADFGGESMANRKYLFFADVAKRLGHAELARLFRGTAAQEAEHAFAHFRLLHPELVVDSADSLSDERRQALLRRCLRLAIEGETYEYTTMHPEFAARAWADRGGGAEAEFKAQVDESQDHATIFRKAASNSSFFAFFAPIERHHAERYGIALKVLQGQGEVGESEPGLPGKWICKVCSMIHDPAIGDPDSGIAAGTPFEAIPEGWSRRTQRASPPPRPRAASQPSCRPPPINAKKGCSLL